MSTMYYLTAAVAIFSTVGYHALIKQVPADIHPLVSVIGIYACVLVLAIMAVPLVLPRAEIAAHVARLGWIQAAVAVTVFGIELGFLLMYRHGWDLSTGNLVTGVVINIALAMLGAFVLKEHLSPVNMAGIALCVCGVAMIGWRGA